MTQEEMKAKALECLEDARRAAAVAFVMANRIGNPTLFGDKTVWAMQDVSEELTKALGKIEQTVKDFKGDAE